MVYTTYRSLPSAWDDVEAFTVLNRLSIRLDETMKGLCAMKENSFNNYNYNIAGMKGVFVTVNQVKKIATTQVSATVLEVRAHQT